MQVTSSLGHVPQGEKWSFDASVTDVFDDMLARSIPYYDAMRSSVFAMASAYVQPQTPIVDLGCSRGEALAPFVEAYGANNTYVGIEVSDTMLEAARARFKNKLAILRSVTPISQEKEDYYASMLEATHVPTVDIRKLDLRTQYPDEIASVTLSVLTLQFTPIEYRQRIVRDVFKHTLPGGAFLLVEKILGSTAELDAQLVKNYYALKSRNGYSQEEIDRKRLSLEGVLVPVTAKWNEELLHMAGFTHIECFWRHLNFAAWIAVKE